MIIKWTNKYSGETGFVRSVNKKERHFDNTFDIAEARKYASVSSANSVIKLLVSFGEADNNDFEVIAG